MTTGWVGSGVDLARRVAARVPYDRRSLGEWVSIVLGVEVPSRGRCAGHGSPMDYLEHAFFERGDAVVWANRGGGKTFYGAVATVLDLVHKPGIEVRVLGGSMVQSERMYEHLRRMFQSPGLVERVAGDPTRRGLRLTNGSAVELLTQSERSVRGQRVQKVRCDEVDLFGRGVWEAVRFVTRSKRCGGFDVRGSVEALSTNHKNYGVMREIVEGADTSRGRQAAGISESRCNGTCGPGLPGHGCKGTCGSPAPLPEEGGTRSLTVAARGDAAGGFRLFTWCVLDVMERCGPAFACESCAIGRWCGGSAKAFTGGFVTVPDVLAMRGRGSAERFESEMLCRYAARTDAVYPGFDPALHVRAVEADRSLTWIGGMDFGVRSPTVVLWAQLREVGGRRNRVEVIDEYVAENSDLATHLRAMRERGWAGMKWIGVDPAGRQRELQTGVSTVEVMRDGGWKVRTKRAKVLEGIDVVRRRLEGSGPLLVIHPRCVKLIEAMKEYHFDADRPRSEDPVKDGPDHAADALRYMLMNLDRVWEAEAGSYL